jgi:hypothetical protein
MHQRLEGQHEAELPQPRSLASISPPVVLSGSLRVVLSELDELAMGIFGAPRLPSEQSAALFPSALEASLSRLTLLLSLKLQDRETTRADATGRIRVLKTDDQL